MEPKLRNDRHQLRRNLQAFRRERINPEVSVLRITKTGLSQNRIRGHQLLLRLTDLACLIPVKRLAVRSSEHFFRALARLPRCRSSERHAEPVLVENALAVIVPNGVQHSLRAELLAIAHKRADVSKRLVVVGVNAAPV